MKRHLLPFAAALILCSIPSLSPLSAQDAEKEAKPAPKAETQESSESEESAEEKAAEQKETATLQAKLAVFKSLEGEWIGEEAVDYNPEFRKEGAPASVKWKDEWKGFFTNEGRYFEMTGKTAGKVNSTYHWYVTYDTENEEYRAWSFGSNGWGEYKGQLTDDGKAVLWEKSREGESVDISDTFELRGKGDKCTASGETKIISKDGSVSRNYAKQHSLYIRKKISI
jgi:hypothetical protein